MKHVGLYLGGFVLSFLSLSTFMLLVSVLQRKEKTKEISKVLFFPDKSHPQTNIQTSLDTISSSRHCLDVCVYCLTGRVFIEAIVSVHTKGVTVRVITDNEQDSVCQIAALRKAGIQVRVNKSSYYMHHKFAIIDKKVVVTGSLNWTTQGIHGNNENVLISDKVEYMREFSQEFDKIWEILKP